MPETKTQPLSKPRLLHLGDGKVVVIDSEDYDYLTQFTWHTRRRCKSYYAQLLFTPPNWKGTTQMSRLIAKTPTNKICHHRNRNSLDNRKANLINMDMREHHILHQNDTLLVKYADKPRLRPNSGVSQA